MFAFFAVVLRRRRRKSVRTHLVREHRNSRRSAGATRTVSSHVEEEASRAQARPNSPVNHEDVVVITTDSDPPEFNEDNQDFEQEEPPPVSDFVGCFFRLIFSFCHV